MTDIDLMIAVLQAAREGKVIQWRVEGVLSFPTQWTDKPLTWDFQRCEYRVKPEPKVIRVHAGPTYFQPVVYDTFEIPNLELEFIDGKLVGAKVL